MSPQILFRAVPYCFISNVRLYHPEPQYTLISNVNYDKSSITRHARRDLIRCVDILVVNIIASLMRPVVDVFKYYFTRLYINCKILLLTK